MVINHLLVQGKVPLYCGIKCATSVIRYSRAVFSHLRAEWDKCHLFIFTCAFCLVSLVLLFAEVAPAGCFAFKSSRSIGALCRCTHFSRLRAVPPFPSSDSVPSAETSVRARNRGPRARLTFQMHSQDKLSSRILPFEHVK